MIDLVDANFFWGVVSRTFFYTHLEADFDEMAIATRTMRIESQTMIDHTAAEARSGVTAIVV